ncbi:MAG: hypothetical protein ABI461_03885 [Polyangiaceae bacterium]
MIDLASGTLFFDDGTEVDPRILRAQFLSSPLEVPQTPDAISAPPWSIYTLAPRLLDGVKFASRLSFEEERLRMLAIWDVEVAEAARMERHDVWMLKALGESSTLREWGKIEAVTEPGGANIVLFSYS